MGKRWIIGAAVFALAAGGIVLAQDPPAPPAPPERPGEEEEELTPEKAMQLLKEARDLMFRSEELLLDSSRGRSLETEKEVLERLKKLLEAEEKENPESSQKKVLETIQKLLRRTEKSQDEAVEKMKEIIRHARAMASQSSQQRSKKQQEGHQQQSSRPQQPGGPAQSPYDPNRTNDPINKFRSRGDRTGRWGDLPPRLREAMFSSRRDLDAYPPEFQEVIKEYMKRLAEEER